MNFRRGILFACGGTGGHIQPAIAVAEALKPLAPDLRVSFVGRHGGMAERSIERAGFPIVGIPVAGWQRKKFFTNLKLLFLFPFSFLLSLWIIGRERPEAVVGTGGYVTVPVLAAALALRIRVYLQEQNSFPGLSTRLFAPFAARVFLGFREAAAHLSPKTRFEVTGNPLRKPAQGGNPRQGLGLDEGEKVLLIAGGSQGSLPINRLMASCIGTLLARVKVSIFWQTGTRDLAYIRDLAAAFPGVRVFDFADNFYQYYQASDLAVCRAGAMTVSELMNYGLPAVFIPLPGAAENHQRKNAKMTEAQGGGVSFEETEGPGKLSALLISLLTDGRRLREMREKMKAGAAPGAADRIARALLEGVRA